MRQKAFLKLEKKLACDLKPGEIYVLDADASLMESEAGTIVFIRTNLPSEEIEDGELLVYKVHIVIVNPEEPSPPKVDPHAPPGMT